MNVVLPKKQRLPPILSNFVEMERMQPVSVSLSSLPPVIKYDLTNCSQSVKVKFCHFKEFSSKIWSLGIRSRVCLNSF